MSKYEIKCSKCGKTYVKELFGKESDRASKIAWLEENGTCIDCYRAEKKETAIEVIKADGHYILAGGDTYSIKETLKQNGFRWGEYFDNNGNMKKAWMTADKENLVKVGFSYEETLEINHVNESGILNSFYKEKAKESDVNAVELRDTFEALLKNNPPKESDDLIAIFEKCIEGIKNK